MRQSLSGFVNRLFRASLLALAIYLLGATRLQAQGGPPYFTNDPGTPGDRQWEINTAYLSLHATDHSTTRTPDLDLNYGLGDAVQLTFEVAWLRDRVSPDQPKYGLGQDTLAVKWRFYGDDPGLAVSVFPQVSINNPTRSVERGIVPPGASVTLPMELSKEFGPIAVNGELGYSLVQSGPEGWLVGVVVGHDRRIRHKRATIELDAEYYAAGEVAGEVTQQTLDGGFRVEVHPPFVLLAMAGRSVRHTKGSFVAYLGLQLLLPPKPFGGQ